MTRRLIQVDAFATGPFSGNPAAVLVLDEPAPDPWMQDVAGEMNLSETAFVVPRADGYDLRWFTPAAEVDLCGHATLASAHVLWEDGHLAAESEARFHTRSGLLTAHRDGDWIEMDFPAEPATTAEPPVGLVDSLGIEPVWCGQNRMDWLVEVADAEAVRAVRPDFTALRTIGARGVMVTAASDDPAYDFVSRFFAPAFGVDEDPVTGSAHCCLGPYWSARTGKGQLIGFQASPRGGVVRVEPRGDRVRLAGQAVTVLRAELLA
jgi:PhzF family phenazine biosynthesis protein